MMTTGVPVVSTPRYKRFPDDSPRLHALGECPQGVLRELVERLPSNTAAIALAFLTISSASSGGNTTLSAGR